MNILIAKLGATGDVVRTTPLLSQFRGHVTWITEAKNIVLLENIHPDLRCVSWEDRECVRDRRYDLAINLEDTIDVGLFLRSVQFQQLYGVYITPEGAVRYTNDAKDWFDLSLVSTYGRSRADQLKFENRRTYQELVFSGLGFRFENQPYSLPPAAQTELAGDVAIATEAGPVWPMKNWAHYGRIKADLESRGLSVNILPKRASLLEHLCDVQNHRCLLGGDSLPMHFALGTGTECVTLFNCTSPWEIHDYGLQQKIVSPALGEFFYKRTFDVRATTAISANEVLEAVLRQQDATKVTSVAHTSH